jgi:hypothetical protein
MSFSFLLVSNPHQMSPKKKIACGKEVNFFASGGACGEQPEKDGGIRKRRQIRPTAGFFTHRLQKSKKKNHPTGGFFTQTSKSQKKSALRAASGYTDFKKSKKIHPTDGFFIHRLHKIKKKSPYGRLLYTQTSKNRKKSALQAASSYTACKKSKKIRPRGGFFIHNLQKIKKYPPYGRLLYTQTSKNQKKSALQAASLYTDFKE